MHKLLLPYFVLLLSLQLPAQDLKWAKHLGGVTTADKGNSVAIDAAGNVYTTGAFEISADFDPGPAVSNLSAVGNFDVYVLKKRIPTAILCGQETSVAALPIAENPSNWTMRAIFSLPAFLEQLRFRPRPWPVQCAIKRPSGCFCAQTRPAKYGHRKPGFLRTKSWPVSQSRNRRDIADASLFRLGSDSRAGPIGPITAHRNFEYTRSFGKPGSLESELFSAWRLFYHTQQWGKGSDGQVCEGMMF